MELATSVELQVLSGDTWSRDALESTRKSLHEGSYDVATGDFQHQVTASQLDLTITRASMPDEAQTSRNEANVDELMKKVVGVTLFHSDGGCE